MSLKLRYWLKIVITLAVIGILALLAPSESIDPWNLISPKKTITMIFALAFIQIFGSVSAQYLGARTGAILTGFFGGLISSTATTASLAKRSKGLKKPSSDHILTFLSATGAMLFEALVVVIAGTTNIQVSNVIIFIGPIIATIAMISWYYKKQKPHSSHKEASTFHLLPIIKLSLFIIAILSISKISQNIFGQNGLLALTSLVSLFEIHGSIIANVQMHDSGKLSDHFLSSLLAVSIISSCLSKLFLISTLGSATLRNQAIKSTLIVLGSVAASWIAVISFIS